MSYHIVHSHLYTIKQSFTTSTAFLQSHSTIFSLIFPSFQSAVMHTLTFSPALCLAVIRTPPLLLPFNHATTPFLISYIHISRHAPSLLSSPVSCQNFHTHVLLTPPTPGTNISVHSCILSCLLLPPAPQVVCVTCTSLFLQLMVPSLMPPSCYIALHIFT